MTIQLAVISSALMFADVEMLSCCPGENTATQARFVWHSESDKCMLYCAKASGTGGTFKIPCRKTRKPVAFRSEDIDYWKYTAEIDTLKPGTEYVYWVKSGAEASARQTFKTGAKNCRYNFLWAGDVHAGIEEKTRFAMDTLELIRQDAEKATASSGGIDFVLFTGDAVRYGSRYDNWRKWNGAPITAKYMFAAVPGNKEYYFTGKNTFYDNHWYLAVKNNPPNGPNTSGQEGCYWFLRDGVLFAGTDSLVYKGSRMDLYGKKADALSVQTNWFDRVATSQKGKYRYIIVFQHDPWFVYSASKNSFSKSRGNYDIWRHVFDKHQVDLALSGDEHNYVRSKPLRGDVEDAGGTVYVTTGEIASKNYSAEISTEMAGRGCAEAAKYLDCAGVSGASCGACLVEVRPESLKLVYFWDKYQKPEFKIYDTVTITPKNRDDRRGGGKTAGRNRKDKVYEKRQPTRK